MMLETETRKIVFFDAFHRTGVELEALSHCLVLEEMYVGHIYDVLDSQGGDQV